MGGKAPKAPDPVKTAAAQSGYDIQTAGASNVMNNPNISNAYGNTNYTVSGYEEVAGPNGSIVKVPRYTQTQTMSQPMQEQFDSRNAMIKQLFGQAQGAQPVETGYGMQNLDQGFLRPDEATMATDRSRVEQAIMDRANPLLKQNRDAEVARLAAMGLAPGGEKYSRVADQAGRTANDLALGAVAAGGQEQSRLLNLYNSGTRDINSARGAQTSMNADQANFKNNSRQQMISQLLSMFGGTQGAQASTGFSGMGLSTPNYAGMVQDKYNQDVGSYNNKMQGIGSLATTMLGFL